MFDVLKPILNSPLSNQVNVASAMNTAPINKELKRVLVELEKAGDIFIATATPSNVINRLQEVFLLVLVEESVDENLNKKIDSTLSKAIHYLQNNFGHSYEYSKIIAYEYHSRFENTPGWADDDYYDLEAAKNIALEAHFFVHLKNIPTDNDMKYIDWSSSYRNPILQIDTYQ